MIENLSGLERFQQEKRKETIDKVTKAIETLEAEGKEVNDIVTELLSKL